MEVSFSEVSECQVKISDYLLDGIKSFFVLVFLKSAASGEVVDFGFYVMTFAWSTFQLSFNVIFKGSTWNTFSWLRDSHRPLCGLILMSLCTRNLFNSICSHRFGSYLCHHTCSVLKLSAFNHLELNVLTQATHRKEGTTHFVSWYWNWAGFWV